MRPYGWLAVVLVVGCGGDPAGSAFDRVQCNGYRLADAPECRTLASKVVSCCDLAPTRGESSDACVTSITAALGQQCQMTTRAMTAVQCETMATTYRCAFAPAPDAGPDGPPRFSASHVCTLGCNKQVACGIITNSNLNGCQLPCEDNANARDTRTCTNEEAISHEIQDNCIKDETKCTEGASVYMACVATAKAKCTR